jgi:hypothetical protein
MADEATDIQRLFADSVLAGRVVRAVTVPGTDAFGYEIDIDGPEAIDAWTVARGAVASLGRWPILSIHRGHSVYSRSEYFGDDVTPGAVVARARDLSLADALAAFRGDGPFRYADEDWHRLVSLALKETADRVGNAPTISAEELDAIRPDFVPLERRLLEWEEARSPTTTPTHKNPDQGAPAVQGPCTLALLPTAASYEAPAYVSFFGASRPMGHEALIAVLGSWQDRYGAELVANWGTMLQLRIARRPTDVYEAFELAIEHATVAPYTLATGLSRRQYARELLNRDHWLLTEPP